VAVAGRHQLVLAEIIRRRRTTRSALIEASGLSAATVSRAVEKLVASGLVTELEDVVTGVRGRKPVLLELNPAAAHVVGIDLGASSCRIVIADVTGEVVERHETTTRSELDAAGLARWLASVVHEVNHAEFSVDQLAIGLPGAVQQDGRLVSNAPNLPQVQEPVFRAELEAAFDVRIALDNDANYALLGELHLGAAAQASSAAMLTIGTGLGAAIAVEGRIVRGRHGIIGEFGQLPVGPLGSRLETLVTGPTLMLRAADLGTTVAHPAELFAEPQPVGIEPLLMQFDNAVVVALTALVVSSDPDVIVLGGGIAKSLGSRLPRYSAALRRALGFDVRIAPAGLGDYSGAVGAAVAGLQTTYDEMGVPPALTATLPTRAASSGS
jgi:predicted NBD/HSP70 family sugar kinase